MIALACFKYKEKDVVSSNLWSVRTKHDGPVMRLRDGAILKCNKECNDIDYDCLNPMQHAATNVLNRTPTRVLKEGCPADLWHGYCDSKKIRVFGMVAYTHIPKEDVKGKLDPRSKPLIMMGFTAKGY
ncbi:hypothetical protein PR048_008112 [Dryococelus australis]|uniref:Uncharacterized protein n=1 Tax=Dryococelus australis TaxID=614101 RepID=A0ABQ9HWB0_9NEOP|nr:hypothetical protein PR048_008112 [Dryococelus australis]